MKCFRIVLLTMPLIFLSLGMAFAYPKEKSSAAPPMAKPEAVGLSADIAQKVHDVVKKRIDAGDTPGVIVLVSRNGKVAYWEAQGVVDAKTQMPLNKDTVFWIASMTKPVVAATVMMMMEEGRLSLDDPISKYIPEFKMPAKVRVLKASSPPLPHGGPANPNAPPLQYDLVAANRGITIKDLLTHTSGIQTIGVPQDIPPVRDGETLASWVTQLPALQLDYQPGTMWSYSNGVAFNILARIVEVASGQTYDQFVQHRVFDPLGMNSTSFGPRKDLESRTMALANPSACALSKTIFCGTAGLWSPADDYWRFGEMLLNKGTLNGKRLLKASSVEQMSSNHVSVPMNFFDNCCIFPSSGGLPPQGLGFGYSVEVILDHTAAGMALPNGAYGWNGVGTRQFWVLPQEKMVIVMYVPSGKATAIHRDIESAVVSSIRH